jgi:hypothetical protein
MAMAKRSKIWVAILNELKYEIISVGTTEREAVDAATTRAALYLNGSGDHAHPDGKWTAKRVEEWYGVHTYHVPIGGAVQP